MGIHVNSGMTKRDMGRLTGKVAFLTGNGEPGLDKEGYGRLAEGGAEEGEGSG